MDLKIIEIFKNELKSDKGSAIEIETLISPRTKSKTNYKPYYQRNYVWQDDKASYLIESILLGYQIPPIILFSRNKNGKKILEIIDGRQRYQTILRYMDNHFSLDKSGLQAYQNLNKKKFNDLEDEMKARLLDSTITQVKYSLSNNVEAKYEDYIIKEIFRRYNSGITKMKTIDNERAEYISDDLNSFFEKYVQKNINAYQKKYSKLFFSQKKQSNLENKYRDAIEELKKIFRKLYVIHLCPIKKSLSKPILLKNIFDSLDTNYSEEELSKEIERFDIKIKIIFNVVEPLFNEEYFFKINKELTTVFYWILSILEQENVNFTLIEKYKELIVLELKTDNNYINFEGSNIVYIHKPFKFELFIKIVNQILKKENITLKNDLSELYIHNKNFTFEKVEKEVEKKNNLEQPIRVHTKEITIDTFLSQMQKRNKYIIRPQYQRNEVINQTKSSGIIESLLLDIKLPPIFVYERKDGVSEIIDGQQRLLSIIGFLGEKYINEAGVLEGTKKSKFKLTGLKILGDELNNKKFEELSEEQKDIIWDSSLTIIKISEEDNPEFDPISLFLRLNIKPYPIDENSFEMWNSYLDKDLTDLIKVNKENKKSYFHDIVQWAYFKKNDKRMENEEIYTILAHIDYQVNNKKIDLLDILDVHMKNDKIIVRLQFVLNKQYTTKSLRDNINLNKNERKKFIQSLKNIKNLFEKIEMLLLVLDDNKENLRKTLDTLTHNKGLVRKKYTFYLLYILLAGIQKSMILENREKDMLTELQEFFLIINDDSIVIDDEEFKAKIGYFIEKYTPNKRAKKLTKDELNILKDKQNSICPLCQNKIFENDKIHIDHIKPISKGGEDDIINMQITHGNCNLKKGNRV